MVVAGLLCMGYKDGLPYSEPPVDPPADAFRTGAVLYAYPENAPVSDAYAVTLNKAPCYVFPVPESTKRMSGYVDSFFPHVANFDITGEVRVAITPKATVNSVKIRPERAGIVHKIKGNTVEFTISRPHFLSIEINGDIEHPLLLFANAPETETPDKDDPDVIFFEAGKIHDRGRFDVSGNKTVYIAPGAIVRGGIIAGNCENIRITGRGILSGELFQGEHNRMIELNSVKNVLIEGITIVDSKHWTIPLMACDGVEIRGIKIVSNTGWDDGIDVVGSSNVTVDGCFIRTKDDCIAVKAGITYFSTTDFTRQNIRNITVKNCVIWNGKHGNGLEIGFETRADTIRDIVFEHIDLIHTENPPTYSMHEGAITIHVGDRATVTDILLRDIRIEDPDHHLIYFEIDRSVYSKDEARGKLRNVRFEDIEVTNTRGTLSSVMSGLSDSNNIENIRFRNVTLNGRKVLNAADLNLSTSFTYDLTFE
jgi:hypothetical protein